MSKPTREAYDELDRAYSFFNERLFDGRLPDCLITLQRSHDSKGYFSANQFVKRTDAENAHEIALNPRWFAVRSLPETLATLVEGMVSLDQHLNSERPPRRRYRNKEWADMAEAVGLMASDTGAPGGKRTGDSVSTYIIDGGPFDQACTELLDQAFVLSWIDRYPPAESLQTAAEPVDEGVPETTALLASPDDLADETSGLDRMAAMSSASTAGADIAPMADGPLLMPDFENEDSTLEGMTGAAPAMTPMLDGNADPASENTPAPSEEAKPSTAPPMKQQERVSRDALEQIGVDLTPAPKNLSKTKFKCPDCGANAWGKPSLSLHCSGAGDKAHGIVAMINAN
ncbi:MAG TPA: hypothetical protein DIT61_04645 [Pseudomonas sp.]|jgi:hypothetical protein|nr:hypothetical protein [Pseudomonas sp.]|tara:strand:+ start:9403 stop:10431 length:1029 start_codon:yes stop_codon:yes gene_type:complete